MAQVHVRFVYEIGLRRIPFHNPLWLRGSWANGRQSNDWSNTPMDLKTGTDGCPAYTVVVAFESDQIGQTFTWGVGSGRTAPDDWLIMTEVRDMNSTDRLQSFTLAGQDNPDQVYRLSISRRLGAQKYFPSGTGEPQLRFAVWAPNAAAVDVVIGRIWLEANQLTLTPFNPPGSVEESAQVKTIHGGYIANDGDGILPGGGNVIPMKRDVDGVWLSNPAKPLPFAHYDHRPYMYRVKRDDGSVVFRTDICSRCQIGGGTEDPQGGAHFTGLTMNLNGKRSCSVVVDPDTVTREDMISAQPSRIWPEKFIGADEFWAGLERPAQVHGLTYPGGIQDLVIYELHLGSLGFGHNAAGSLDDALKLLDYLTDLGVNAVELLPLSEFGGGTENWGYATSHYFAVEYAGGGRDHFKLFVRECHRRGIAVIMDVVYNHYAHDAERAEWLFDTTDHGRNAYYWYEGRPSDYPAFDAAVGPGQRGYGGYLDNLSTAFAPRYWEETVRKTLISSAVTLMDEFNVDGFRVDQTTSIHAYNVRHADGQSVNAANAFGVKMLREFSRTLRTIRPGVILMAEDHSGWNGVTTPISDGGLGFDAAWNADYHHHLVGQNYGTNYAKLIPTAAFGTNAPLAMDWFAEALGASGQNKVVYHTSHDEAGNADKDNPDPDKRTHRTIVLAVRAKPTDDIRGLTREYAEARCRFAAGVTLLSAGTPLILFGEEVGFQKDLIYDAVLNNREDLVGYSTDGNHGKFLFQFYQDLIRMRLGNAGLRSRNIKILHVHNANRVVAFKRWNDGQEFLILASLNDTPFNSPTYIIEHPDIWEGSRWREMFNSDSERYRGANIGNFGMTLVGQPGRFEAVIPANGFVVFARQ